jgi:HNH endonuclease
MPIVISKAFKKKIADANSIESDKVEDRLWTKSGELCHLCDGELNRTADQIHIDHDKPENDGGSAEFDNLHLAHASCNKFKADHRSIDVRPFLKFKRFHQEHEGSLNFSEAQEYFGVKPKPVVIERKGKTATFHLPDGTKPSAAVFAENVSGKSIEYCFVDLPLTALWNDEDVQPRKIKINHLFLIASDLRTNPLHEQPTCRLISTGAQWKLALFDGQHKALAKALNGNLATTYKVYLDLNREQATTLVNSIQAKIKKLPLTPFELVAKMSDELRDRFAAYESEVGTGVSEAGFVEWTPASERTRAKSEISSAVIDEFLKSGDVQITELIQGHPDASSQLPLVRESAFQNKFLKQLLHCTPLPKQFSGEELREARQRERVNLTRALNLFFDNAFAPTKEGASQLQKDAAKRMTYQASLEYIAELLRKIILIRVVPTTEELAFVEKPISEKQWTQIGKDIKRLCTHPIWTAKLDASPKTRAVKDALEKNTGARQAFAAMGLTPGYCVGI